MKREENTAYGVFVLKNPIKQIRRALKGDGANGKEKGDGRRPPLSHRERDDRRDELRREGAKVERDGGVRGERARGVPFVGRLEVDFGALAELRG